MKKYLYPLLLALLLSGCQNDNSSSASNNSGPNSVNNSTSTSAPDSQNSDSGNYIRTETQVFSAKLDFTTIVNKFSGYENTSVVMEEKDTIKNTSTPVLVSFDSTSKQSTKITDAPVLKAADADNHEAKYITLLSDTMYNITEASVALSVYNDSDVANVGLDYYLGLEYLTNEGYKRLNSIDITKLEVGAHTNDLEFNFKISEPNVYNLRLAFDFPNATAPIRFGVYSLSYSGSRCIYKTNEISDIAVTTEELSLNVGETKTIECATTPSNLNKYLEFVSDNRAVAVVNESGVIKALSAGKANITIKSGNVAKTLKLNVTVGNHQKIIQENVEFSEIPAGFTSNFETYFNATYLNFKVKDNYLLTPKYEVNGPTVVSLTMKLSSSANIEDSAQNIFTVIGLNDAGEEVEKVQKQGLTNLDFMEINYEFTNTTICQYKILYESKFGYGKNYVLKSLIIYEN